LHRVVTSPQIDVAGVDFGDVGQYAGGGWAFFGNEVFEITLDDVVRQMRQRVRAHGRTVSRGRVKPLGAKSTSYDTGGAGVPWRGGLAEPALGRERFRRGEPACVAVHDPRADDHDRAFGNRDARDLGRAHRAPAQDPRGWVEPERLGEDRARVRQPLEVLAA